MTKLQTALVADTPSHASLLLGVLGWFLVPIAILLTVSGYLDGFWSAIGAIAILIAVALWYALWYGTILLFWLFLAFLAIRFIKAAWSW